MNEQQPEALRLADRIDLKDYYEFDASLHCQKAAAELRRLHIVEKEFQRWITKTEWVQKSSQSHELGMHRADVMKQRIDQLLTENQQLRSALEQPQANQPAMTPIAQRKLDSLLAEGYTISGYSVYHEQKHQHGFVTGAGLVGWWRPEGVEYPQPRCEQPLRYLDGGSRYKVTHLKTSGYCIIGLPEELLGRWVALVDATDNKHMDSHQQPPTTEQSSAVERPQGEQGPVAWISPRALEWETRQSEKVVKLTCKAQPEYGFTEPLYTHSQPKREPLTDNQIDKIAESMPGGLEGFLKGWGWRQFERAVLENDHNIK